MATNEIETYEPAPLFLTAQKRARSRGTVAADPRDVPALVFSAMVTGPSGARPRRDPSIPMAITPQLIPRARSDTHLLRVCHGRLGDGNGMIVQRGMIRPPSFHNDGLSDLSKTHRRPLTR